MFHNQKLGQTGEDLACDYLINKGFVLIQRNFKARYGEIDIIVKEKNTFVFVEVKTRRSDAFGAPEEAITRKKLSEVIKTAQFFLQINNLHNVSWRVDVISILFSDASVIKHFANITLDLC